MALLPALAIAGCISNAQPVATEATFRELRQRIAPEGIDTQRKPLAAEDEALLREYSHLVIDQPLAHRRIHGTIVGPDGDAQYGVNFSVGLKRYGLDVWYGRDDKNAGKSFVVNNRFDLQFKEFDAIFITATKGDLQCVYQLSDRVPRSSLETAWLLLRRGSVFPSDARDGGLIFVLRPKNELYPRSVRERRPTSAPTTKRGAVQNPSG